MTPLELNWPYPIWNSSTKHFLGKSDYTIILLTLFVDLGKSRTHKKKKKQSEIKRKRATKIQSTLPIDCT